MGLSARISGTFQYWAWNPKYEEKNKLFHHDRLSIMPLWSRSPSVVREFGDMPSGEGVGGLPEPGTARVGELAAPY